MATGMRIFCERVAEYVAHRPQRGSKAPPNGLHRVTNRPLAPSPMTSGSSGPMARFQGVQAFRQACNKRGWRVFVTRARVSQTRPGRCDSSATRRPPTNVGLRIANRHRASLPFCQCSASCRFAARGSSLSTPLQKPMQGQGGGSIALTLSLFPETTGAVTLCGVRSARGCRRAPVAAHRGGRLQERKRHYRSRRTDSGPNRTGRRWTAHRLRRTDR